MTVASQMPVCRIIAGPNGAGKTTFALKYLPEVAPGTAFINADLIAAGLSPLAPDQQQLAASRLFLQQIALHVIAEQDFAFETTLDASPSGSRMEGMQLRARTLRGGFRGGCGICSRHMRQR